MITLFEQFYLVNSYWDLALFIVYSALALIGLIALIDEYKNEKNKK